MQLRAYETVGGGDSSSGDSSSNNDSTNDNSSDVDNQSSEDSSTGGGCFSMVGFGSGFAGLALASVALVLFRKKREENYN